MVCTITSSTLFLQGLTGLVRLGVGLSFSLPSSSVASVVSTQSFHKGISKSITTKRTIMSTKNALSNDLSSSEKMPCSLVDDVLTGKFEIPILDGIRVHESPNVKFVDGTWWLPVPSSSSTPVKPKTGREGFEVGPRIVGASFLDIDDIADTNEESNPLGLPHMMPSARLMSVAMQAAGIRQNDHVIVYVQERSCPFGHRAWFQFGCMGHPWERTHVLQGSLQDWIDAGGPVDVNPVRVVRASQLDWNSTDSDQVDNKLYRATEPKNIVTMEEIRRIVTHAPGHLDGTILVDARPPDRFWGKVGEPRPGLHRGHIPFSKNVFFLNVLNEDNRAILRSPDELRLAFQQAGISLDQLQNPSVEGSSTVKRIVASCGSGVTACTLVAALYKLGLNIDQLALYDGSWAEWGNMTIDNPIITEATEKYD